MQPVDFFRNRIDATFNLNDSLVVLVTRLPCSQIEAGMAPKCGHQNRVGQVRQSEDMFGTTQAVMGGGRSNAGRPRLAIRLMASLLYLKGSFSLSDEELVVRWSENILWPFFNGLDYYEQRLPCGATQIGRFRRALGEEGLALLPKATIDTVVLIGPVKPKDLERVIVDATVQEKAIAQPLGSRLLEIAPRKLVSAAKRAGIQLKQAFAKEDKTLRWRAGSYAHAKRFRRLQLVFQCQRTFLGVGIREVQSKIWGPDFASAHSKAINNLGLSLELATRIQTQLRNSKTKLYALHAPEVECIGKGKAKMPYEFGVKSAVVASHEHGLMLGAHTVPGTPYDGHILNAVLEEAINLTQDVAAKLKHIVVDLGLRGVDADNSDKETIPRGNFKSSGKPQKSWPKRRTAVESAIGHLNSVNYFGLRFGF